MVLDLPTNIIPFVFVSFFKQNLHMNVRCIQLRKNSRSHAFLVDPTTAVSERITSASCNSDFPQQTALTIRELPTLPEKASSYQICTNEPQDNLTRGEQICSSLSIYEIGHTRIKKSVLLL
ncbi:uncharacterized protein LOC107858691 isoform X2 [Capsicum annuum]|uniref:uncharacterized protein LOC107858691 isoform X2 n=1 Tax=Capsicum annuum TaxID=4072 RepID=UPI001FB0CB2A|nr:uncharacterized protein LOC107858691 isoform X2 [Capsicum annuum]